MRARLPILIAVAGAAAFGAVFLARNWLDDRRAELAALQRSEPVQVETIDTVEVLIALEDLPTGTFLSMEQFDWTAFPADNIPDTYLTRAVLAEKAEALGNPEDPLAGAVIRGVLTAGEPLTAGRIIRPGERGFLAAVLRPGQRAVSLPVDATTGIAGFVFPGDRVDLLLTHEIEIAGAGKRRASETVLTDVRVLAVDQRTDHSEGGPALAKTATLEVDPEAAEVIAVALRMGRLSLALRALATLGDAPATAIPSLEGDAEGSKIDLMLAAEVPGLYAPDLRGYSWDSHASQLLPPVPSIRQPSAVPKAPPPPTRQTVTIFRSSDAQEVSFSGKAAK